MINTSDMTTLSGDERDQVEELPRKVKRVSNSQDLSGQRSHRQRHSKKLSLNFPIYVQPYHDGPPTGSASPASWVQSPTSSAYHSGTPLSARPLPSPDETANSSAETPDFLTMIAGQERRVMELKEELHKAESELTGLKKQWAVFEAKKKQAEIRSKTVKMGPISPHSTDTSFEDEEAERLKRREAREKLMRDMANKEDDLSRSNSVSGKRNGGRVFNGRHTRTLSLLQNNPALAESQQHTVGRLKSRTESGGAAAETSNDLMPTSNLIDLDDDRTPRTSRPSVSRQPTLQELIATSATGAAQLNFGKTYKELATASRKSLPPGADVFVKQGKQVYDGVSQGFWNFVEDIRQATVGDEAINGVPQEPRREVRRIRSNKKLETVDCERHAKRATKKSQNGTNALDEHKGEKDNFWKEFGLETPQSKKPAQSRPSKQQNSERGNETVVKDHESKSSTDSKCPPSLLADVMDIPEDDDTWDTWLSESPVAQRHSEHRVAIRSGSESEHDAEQDNRRSSMAKAYPKQQTLRGGPVDASWPELTT